MVWQRLLQAPARLRPIEQLLQQERLFRTRNQATIIRISNSNSDFELRRRSLATIAEDNIVRPKCPDVEIPRKHFFDVVWGESVEKWGDRTALINGATNESFTFSESRTESFAFASAISTHFHLVKGDVLAAMLPNCPEYAFLVCGASLLGMPVTTVNPANTPAELAGQLDTTRACVVVTLDAFLSKVREAIKKRKDKHRPVGVISLDAKTHSEGVQSYARLRAGVSNPPDVKRAPNFDFGNDILTLLYSSGTTGLPKGVMQSHKCTVANMMQLIHAEGYDFIRFPDETFQPKTVCILPIFHIYAMMVTLFPTLCVGGQVVTLPAFDPASFVKALGTYQPNFLHLAPPLVAFCANHPSVLPAHLASLECVMVGAAPVGPALMQKFKEKAPQVSFREGWGMTEMGVGTITPLDDEVKGSCGLNLPNTLAKIADLETGKALGPNVIGELCFKGPQVMKGYLRNQKATAATIRGGWLHTGDIAYYDESEHFFIVDRLKELIKVKGMQVAPAELEDLLRRHPAILDVAVVGVPCAKSGEAPRAYVVRKNAKLTAEQVVAFVDAEVADYKRLAGGVEFIKAVPKSAAGKILRKSLVEAYRARME